MSRGRIASRVFAFALIVLGGVLMFAAPETAGKKETFNGIALIVVGLVIEIIGIAMERR